MAEPLNATFFAFRKREKSGVLTKAAIGFAIGLIVISVAFFAAFASALLPLASWYAGLLEAAATNDPAALEQLSFPPALGMFVLGALVWTFALYVLMAAFEAACLRWMIRGESGGGLLGLTFGADMWRVYSGYWIWFLLYIAFSMALGMISGLVMIPIVTGMMAQGQQLDPYALQYHPVSLVLSLVQYALMAYFGTRMAPANAASIARKKFAFFDAWKTTRGRFWAMFGAFFLLFLIYAVLLLVFYGVMFATVLTPALPALSSMGSTPQDQANTVSLIMQTLVQSFSSPQTWAIMGVLYVLMTIVGVVFYVALFGINARAAQAALEEGKIAAPTM